MADIETGTIRAHDPEFDSEFQGTQDPPSNPLDGEEQQKDFAKLLAWWEEAKEAQEDSRRQMAIDEDYYDSEQWTAEEITELRERHQAPLVFNHIASNINWLTGTERRTRMDFRVHPRNDNPEDQESAHNKTKLLKYINDQSLDRFIRSRVFEDAVKAGIGWYEDGVRDDPGDEPIYSRHESWRNIWYDALATEMDLSDARYIFRVKWLDLDVAQAMFPDRAKALETEARTSADFMGEDEEAPFLPAIYREHTDNGDIIFTRGIGTVSNTAHIFSKRKRIKAIECWFRKPKPTKILRGFNPVLNGQEFTGADKTQQAAIDDGVMSLYDAVIMKVHCAIWTGRTLLQLMESPYRHNEYPFTPVWGYRKARDGMPYGAIRNLRDPQSDLNKRASKALFAMSTNRVIADRNAIDQSKWHEIKDEAARPDAAILLRDGEKRFDIVNNDNLAEGHLLLMDRDVNFIQSVSGITGENLGRDTKAISGRAILAKQNEGSAVTFSLFDNARYADQKRGEKKLALIEQYMDYPKTIRLVGPKGATEFTNINEPEFGLNGELVIRNQITNTKSDFIIDFEDWRASVRIAAFEQLLEMLGDLGPDVALHLLDLVMELSDLPGKDEFVRRIRMINGQRGPDEKETPEQAAARMQQQQQQMQQQLLNMREQLSKTREREKRTEKIGVESVDQSLDAAAKLAVDPETAKLAASILETARYGEADAGI